MMARFFDDDTNSNPTFGSAALGRQLFYAALSLGSERTKHGPRRRSPSWTDLSEKYERFSNALCVEGVLKSIPHDMLRNFGTHSVTKARARNLPPSIALFLINEHEESEAFRAVIDQLAPQEEVPFLRNIRSRLLEPATNGIALEQIERNLATESLETVNMGFAVERTHQSHFAEFFSAFKCRKDGFAHFTTYRHARSDPLRLVKSFLAIGEPDANRNYYRFFHFYQVPSVGRQNRLTRGFVLPLSKAVYLVGGQSHDRGVKKSYSPFDTLEVIALDWNELNIPESLFGGMMMSANYQHSKLLAPMALRATPISKYEELGSPLNQIDIQCLAEDIQADTAVELESYAESFVSSPIDHQCAQVRELTNAHRSVWQVSHGFTSAEDSGKSLTKNHIESLLESVFGTSLRPRFKSANNEPFDFWKSIRFGPLSRK